MPLFHRLAALSFLGLTSTATILGTSVSLLNPPSSTESQERIVPLKNLVNEATNKNYPETFYSVQNFFDDSGNTLKVLDRLFNGNLPSDYLNDFFYVLRYLSFSTIDDLDYERRGQYPTNPVCVKYANNEDERNLLEDPKFAVLLSPEHYAKAIQMHKFVHYLGDDFKSLGASLQPQAWLDQQTRQIVYKTNGETFYLPNGFSLALISGLNKPTCQYVPSDNKERGKTVTAHYTDGLLDKVSWTGFVDRLGNPVNISLEISNEFHEKVAAQKLDPNVIFPYYEKCLHVDDPRDPDEFMKSVYEGLDEVLSLGGVRSFWDIQCSLGSGNVELHKDIYSGPEAESSISFFLGDHQSVRQTVFANVFSDSSKPETHTLTYKTWTEEELLDATWIPEKKKDGAAE